MTLLSFRRRRRTRQPVPASDFPADDADTATLGHIPDWDGTTITFGGTSDVGLPEDDAYPHGHHTGIGDETTWHPAPGYEERRGLDTQPIAQHPGPATLPVLPPEPAPEPPHRPADAAFFIPLFNIRCFGLQCGMDRWRRHTDPEAAHYANMFDALRVSAFRADWRPDAYGRWCCPRCVMNPAYVTPQPLDHWHPNVRHARLVPGQDSREHWKARPATEYHDDAAAALIAGDPAAEFWFRVQAEAEVLARTADGASHGRHHGTHEAGAR